VDLSKLIKLFSEFDQKFGNTPLLISVRRGLTFMIPLVLLGSIALVFLSLPIPGYQRMMEEFFGSQWKNIFLFVRDGTFNIMSLIMVICISYSYCVEYGERYGNNNVSPIIATSVSLGSFIAILGIGRDGFDLANFGVIGVFVAIIVAAASSIIFLKLSSIKALRMNAFTEGANLVFNYALNSIYPAAVTVLIFAIINQVLTVLFGITDIQSFISDFFSNVFLQMDSPFWSAVLFIGLIHTFWFFGIHGSNILEPVAQNIYVPTLTANQNLIALGQAPTEIFTKTFFDTFVLMGGSGTTLCLIMAILIAGKHKNILKLAKLSFIPVIFNINELIVFGIPIVLNPTFIIPFLFVPLILTVSSFLAVYSGLVPYTSNLVEWTTPVFLSGYTSTHSISGSLLQLFNLVLGTLCYIPFVKLAQVVLDAQGRNNFDKVYALFKQGEERGMVTTLLNRNDDIGSISRFLAADLEHDLQTNKVALYYQPQVDFEGNVFGVEALLRWNHDNYGYIYPPLIIALAEEAQIIDKLGFWIVDTACSDLSRMYQLGLKDITVSVNISSAQLEDDSFFEHLEEVIKKRNIRPNTLKIEITEQLALSNSRRIINRILALKKLGVKLAMDDFGMGHSSLMYLKEYDFDTIKLDGSLVREILSNSNCRNIISSIIYLSRSLNYSVLAEYVENEQQRIILHQLGCNQYQGWLYSKAIPYNKLINFIRGA